MRTKTQVMKGLLSGKILLPIPAVATKFDLRHNNTDKQDHFDRTVLHNLESVVIEWSYQIREVLKLESSLLLLRGLNVGPETELGFWKGRQDNLQCISEQFQSPDVQTMGNILHAKESSYYTTFKTLSKEVEHALVEARDVELHLRPLRQHIEFLRETEFPRTHILIPPLFHTICLIWSHSKFYSIPARIIVLLQEFCNLLIDQV
ncbi:hypothetical protein NDU88_005599 [Pleurodeles waltl]|uniref:Dynein heavy chain tail domain-containing protein n=1 Tax=Pleurodeles waltl TaxID=8319 RepID=A0AAV7MDF2_PLEWA|nr:hypothetical protein NDU88_005599 [Pleurodeles waltl]